MAISRHYLDQLMLSLFDRESVYDAGPGLWTATGACSMLEFDDASAHEEWDDDVEANEAVINNAEFPTYQEITRQSVKIAYNEPRAKPNSLAGLIGLTLGTVVSAQDGVLVAYRHKLTPASGVALPSIGAQVKRDNGRQYKYTGIKSDGFTLGQNKGHLDLAVRLIGSGTRATAADAFAAAISETWLRWGDAKIFVKPTSGTAITIPATPAQGAVNLGASNVDLSTRVLNPNIAFTNGLQADLGYRISSGKVRSNLHPARRSGMISFRLEVESANEAAELDYYLNQTKLAFEINLDSGTIIAATGAFKFGMIVIVPLMQFKTIKRTHESEREVLDLEGIILGDGTNPEIVIWVYNAQSVYLV